MMPWWEIRSKINPEVAGGFPTSPFNENGDLDGRSGEKVPTDMTEKRRASQGYRLV